MNLRIGFFKDFKGKDSVLLAGSPQDIASLSVALGEFVASHENSLSVHLLASVSTSHPTQLFAQRSPSHPVPQFCWLCSPNEYANIRGKLDALASSAHGHQYFDLVGSSAQLVVSVGEYNASWWEAHG